MKIRLRSLFALTAMAAIVSCWLAMRKVERTNGALFQVTGVTPTTWSGDGGGEERLSERFYSTTLKYLRTRSPETIAQLRPPERMLRQAIRFETCGQDAQTALVKVTALGNPLTGDDDMLETFMEASVESLRALADDPPNGTRIKLLNLPRL
jgi:hypothetical protein